MWKSPYKQDILECIGEDCQYGKYLVCNVRLDFDYQKRGFDLFRARKSYQYGAYT